MPPPRRRAHPHAHPARLEPPRSTSRGSQHQIELLNFRNFESHVSADADNRVWFVQFYAHWSAPRAGPRGNAHADGAVGRCEHSQGFADIFRAMAAYAAPWSSVLRIAAIDCGDEDNRGGLYCHRAPR